MSKLQPYPAGTVRLSATEKLPRAIIDCIFQPYSKKWEMNKLPSYPSRLGTDVNILATYRNG